MSIILYSSMKDRRQIQNLLYNYEYSLPPESSFLNEIRDCTIIALRDVLGSYQYILAKTK